MNTVDKHSPNNSKFDQHLSTFLKISPKYHNIVENEVKAFEGQAIHVPQARFGPQPTPLGDIVLIDCNGE